MTGVVLSLLSCYGAVSAWTLYEYSLGMDGNIPFVLAFHLVSLLGDLCGLYGGYVCHRKRDGDFMDKSFTYFEYSLFS